MKTGAQEAFWRRMLSWTWSQRIGVDSLTYACINAWYWNTVLWRTDSYSENKTLCWMALLTFILNSSVMGRLRQSRASFDRHSVQNPKPHQSSVHSHCRAGEPCSYPSTSSMLGTAGTLGAAGLSHCGTEGHRRRRTGKDWVYRQLWHPQPTTLTDQEGERQTYI